MTELFLTVLNMSITGTLVILALLILRLLFKRLPRICSYLLWSVVLLRLICPFAVEADFGIIPSIRIGEEQAQEEMPEGMGLQADMIPADSWEVYDEGVLTYGKRNGQDAGTEKLPTYKEIPATFWNIAGVVWLIGAVLFVSYGGYSYGKLQKKLRGLPEQAAESKKAEYRTVVSESIETPFTAGFLRPTIYLPTGLCAENREMVMEHEKTHIRRRDYLVKTAAYFITCIHWFNPLVWLSFHLLEADMETSCDEAVLRRVGYDRRKVYAKALLTLSSAHPMEIGKCPLAFGENNVKKRIENAVKSKKVKRWITAGSVILAFGIIILLAVNGTGTSNAAIPTMAPEEETADAQVSEVTEEPIITQMPEITEAPVLTQEPEAIQVPIDAEADDEIAAESLTDSTSVLLINPSGNYYDVEILYTIPLAEGLYRITSPYGKRVHPVIGAVLEHNGIDFAAEEGTAINAAADGRVYETGFHSYCGNYVIVCHNNGEVTYYMHCSEILVEDGQSVSRGENIARVGTTGASTGPHLHFAVSYGGEYIEPVFMRPEE